jgi:hypothetical protein
MSVACKNYLSPSTLAFGWHEGSDDPIGPSILRTGGNLVTGKYYISLSILAYVWDRFSDVLIGLSIFACGWQGGRVQD